MSNDKVRVRLCYSGHEESVIGEMVGFNIEFSGFSMTQGFGLINWYYEYGQPSWCEQHTPHASTLFIKWESVFVVESLEPVNKSKQLISGGRRKIDGL